MITPNPVQTTYTQYVKPAQVGMPASTTGWDVDNRIAECDANGIGFGLAVSQSNQNDRAAVLGQLSGGVFVGITRADPTLPNLNASTTDHYLDTDNMAVQTRGDIWVAPATNVSAGGSVYFNSVTGALGASSISNAVLIPGARWMTSYPNTDNPSSVPFGQLAVVRLNAE